MGYYVKGHGSVKIAEENLGKAYEALMALQDLPDEAKRGGGYSGGQRTGAWYSWMPSDLRTLPDTRAVFVELGFDTDVDTQGNLVIFAYDNKTGQEEVFFAAAAPFIKEGGEFYWEGEDGMLYKWEFRDGKMYWLDGVAEYHNQRQYTVRQFAREYGFDGK